jgi:hypothetical protein
MISLFLWQFVFWEGNDVRNHAKDSISVMPVDRFTRRLCPLTRKMKKIPSCNHRGQGWCKHVKQCWR